jgi:hypothetical protein
VLAQLNPSTFSNLDPRRLMPQRRAWAARNDVMDDIEDDDDDHVLTALSEVMKPTGLRYPVVSRDVV